MRGLLLVLIAIYFGQSCIGAPATLQAGSVTPDAVSPRDSGLIGAAVDAAPPAATDSGEPLKQEVRAYGAPLMVHLQDSQLNEEGLEITEPWFGASNEMYFRSEGFLVQENFNVSCNWPATTCRTGGQLQSFGPNGADMIRPCTLGTAALQPQRGPMLYGNGSTLFLQLPSTGDGRHRTLIEGVTFAYAFPGTSDFSGIDGKTLKVFHYTMGGGVRGTVVESANWGRFDGTYHAADSASAPTLLVYTDAQGLAAARARDKSGSWTEAPEIVTSLTGLYDARMTWMSADTSRIVFSAKASSEGRALMYTATR